MRTGRINSETPMKKKHVTFRRLLPSLTAQKAKDCSAKEETLPLQRSADSHLFSKGLLEYARYFVHTSKCCAMHEDPHFRFEQPCGIEAPLVTRVRRTCRSVQSRQGMQRE